MTHLDYIYSYSDHWFCNIFSFLWRTLNCKITQFFLHSRYGRSGAIFGARSTSLRVLAVFCRLYFMVMEDSDWRVLDWVLIPRYHPTSQRWQSACIIWEAWWISQWLKKKQRSLCFLQVLFLPVWRFQLPKEYSTLSTVALSLSATLRAQCACVTLSDKSLAKLVIILLFISAFCSWLASVCISLSRTVTAKWQVIERFFYFSN